MRLFYSILSRTIAFFAGVTTVSGKTTASVANCKAGLNIIKWLSNEVISGFSLVEELFASLPRVTRGAPTVLKGDPKGKNFLYTNGNSVFIRDIEVGCTDWSKK